MSLRHFVLALRTGPNSGQMLAFGDWQDQSEGSVGPLIPDVETRIEIPDLEVYSEDYPLPLYALRGYPLYFQYAASAMLAHLAGDSALRMCRCQAS